jgi:two-component system, NarL family, nitrate/nitrite response regulator NarL
MRRSAPSVILRLVRRRYLIVDDSLQFLTAARTLLERQGLWVVGVAATASECLRCAEQLAPDVILVDVDLGHENGFDLARRLARRGISAEVIFISMHAGDDYAEIIAESGAAGFLPKSALSKEAIERVLGGASSPTGCSASG